MSFTLKVYKNVDNQISPRAEFKIWQRITFVDDSTVSKEIFPLLIPLDATVEKMKSSSCILEPRINRYLIYHIAIYNPLGITVDRDVGGDYYFQFRPDLKELPLLSTIKNIEYSTDQNFSNTLSNLAFSPNYTFQKLTNTDYTFFFLAEDNTKYYEKILKPFVIDYPDNTKKIVKNTFENIQLPIGYYQIDGISHFFDRNNEVLPSHYIIKVSI